MTYKDDAKRKAYNRDYDKENLRRFTIVLNTKKPEDLPLIETMDEARACGTSPTTYFRMLYRELICTDPLYSERCTQPTPPPKDDIDMGRTVEILQQLQEDLEHTPDADINLYAAVNRSLLTALKLSKEVKQVNSLLERAKDRVQEDEDIDR